MPTSSSVELKWPYISLDDFMIGRIVGEMSKKVQIVGSQSSVFRFIS